MKEIIIFIHSVSDIITNSSSESFIIECNKTKSELERLIRNMVCTMDYGNSSGMGGIIEVQSIDDLLEKAKGYYPLNKRYLVTKSIIALDYWIDESQWKNAYKVCIDEGYVNTIETLLKTFRCIESIDLAIAVHKETGEVRIGNSIYSSEDSKEYDIYDYFYIDSEGNRHIINFNTTSEDYEEIDTDTIYK